MTCFILSELISYIVNHDYFSKILELDNLISTKIYDKRKVLTIGNKKILRNIFKCEKLSQYVTRASSEGFLNLSKLCFNVISLNNNQIEEILNFHKADLENGVYENLEKLETTFEE